MANRPTDKQIETLEWIASFYERNGMPPTVREIGQAFGIKSSSAQARVTSLLRKGHLRRNETGARSIFVVDPLERLSKQRPDAGLRQTMHPPFRPDDLLHVDAFIAHCKTRGVWTDREQLEYYDQEAILLPAVRVKQTPQTVTPLKEAVSIRNSDDIKKTLVPGENNERPISEWLPEYLEGGRAEHPAETPFCSWEPGSPQTFVDETGKVWGMSRGSEALYYSRYQLIPLREIQRLLTVKLQDRVLFGSDEEWRKLGRTIRVRFAGARERARNTILHRYRYLSVLTTIHDLLDQRAREAASEYEENRNGDCSYKEAFKDAIATFDDILRPKEEKTIRLALSGAQLSCEELDNFRVQLHIESRIPKLGLDARHVLKVRDQILDHTPHSYRFVRDCDALVRQLTWILTQLRYRFGSLSELDLGHGEHRVCAYCESGFKPRSNRQVTCGSKGCKNAQKNATKRIKRHWGLYDS